MNELECMDWSHGYWRLALVVGSYYLHVVLLHVQLGLCGILKLRRFVIDGSWIYECEELGEYFGL